MDSRVGPAARQYYDCACTRAARRDYAPALDALELAVVDPELMMGARTDASFAELRDPDKVRAPGQACDPGNLHLPLATEVVRFYQIVGQPGPGRFTALAPSPSTTTRFGRGRAHRARPAPANRPRLEAPPGRA